MTMINGHIFLPYLTNWFNAPANKRVWETEMAELLDGYEQRRALRAVPRRSVSYSIFATSLQQRSRLEAELDAALLSGLACAPLFGRAALLSAGAASGTDTLVQQALVWRWQAGDYAVLLDDSGNFDAIEVSAVSGDGLTLTLASNLTHNWPAQARVWPLMFGKITAGKEQVVTDFHGATTITITELVSGRSVQIGTTPAHVPGVGEQVIGSTNVIG